MNTYLMIEILFPRTKNIQEISKILEKYKITKKALYRRCNLYGIEKIQEMKYITITNLLSKSCDRIALWRPSIYRIIGRSTDHRQISSLGGSASQKILISRLKVIVSYHSCFKSITHCQWCCREIFTGKHMVSHLKMRAAQGSNHCIGKQYSWSIHHLVT